MKELSHGQIDDVAVIHYIIKGLNDKIENKTILYGCKTLSEFKGKLKVYELRNDYAKNKKAFDRPKMHDTNVKNPFYGKQKFNEDVYAKHANELERKSYNNYDNCRKTFCYNCKDQNYISKFCVHKEKGIKCFKCNALGHKASECIKK